MNWRWPYPVRPGSLNSNAWPARQRPAAPRYRLSPTLPHAPHGVPGEIDVRARLAAHGSVDLGGAALAIKTDAHFAIGPIAGRIYRPCHLSRPRSPTSANPAGVLAAGWGLYGVGLDPRSAIRFSGPHRPSSSPLRPPYGTRQTKRSRAHPKGHAPGHDARVQSSLCGIPLSQ